MQPYKDEYWTVTAGNLSQARTRLAQPDVTDQPKYDDQVVVDPSQKYQKWQGAGAAITDATASLIWKLPLERRKSLLHELFSPSEGNFSLIRVPMASCDFGSGEVSKTQFYSYDDVVCDHPDLQLKHFSIGEGLPGAENATKDMRYMVPVLQAIIKINPNVKILAIPWSAPAWMKDSGKIENGGYFRKDICRQKLLTCYAQYFVKFLQTYQKLGIKISALCIQNGPNFKTPGPSMNWTMEELAVFGSCYLKPALYRDFRHVKLHFWDGSLDKMTPQSFDQINNDDVKAFDGIAFHTYIGPFANIENARKYDSKWELAMTERRCMMNKKTCDASHVMMGLIGNYLVRHGLSSIYLWNLALDERGLPNIAGSTGRRGVITIEHTTGKIMRNLEYYMLRNFSQDVAIDSQLVSSTNCMKDDFTGGASSVAFMEPAGSLAVQLYNPTDQKIKVSLSLKDFNRWQNVLLPAYGTVTVHKSNQKMNESEPTANDSFKLNPLPVHLV